MLVFLVVLAVMTPQAKAATTPPVIYGPSGAELVADCRNVVLAEQGKGSDGMRSMKCMSYVAGVIDTSSLSAAADTQTPFCIPIQVHMPQIVKMVVKFGDEHPENLNFKRFIACNVYPVVWVSVPRGRGGWGWIVFRQHCSQEASSIV